MKTFRLIFWRVITTILYLTIAILGSILGVALLPWGILLLILVFALALRIGKDIKNTLSQIKAIKKEANSQTNSLNFTDEEFANTLFRWEQINGFEWICTFLGKNQINDILILEESISSFDMAYTINGIKFSADDAHRKYGFPEGTTIVKNNIGQIDIIKSGYSGIKHLEIPIPEHKFALAQIKYKLVEGEEIARINYSEEVIQTFSQQILEKHKALQEEEQKRKEQEEEHRLEEKIKARQAKRELEKKVRQRLIDSGELFGEETKRPKIPREVVDAIYRRDGGRCVYCGSTDNLQLDHIIPFSRGGATTIDNLQLLCQKCNLEKSNKIG